MKSRPVQIVAAVAIAAAFSCSDNPSGPADTSDRTPPERITGAALVYPDTGGNAVLSWTAPADDRAPHTVARYEIRYAHSTPIIWDLAIAGDDPPQPADPGELETWMLSVPARGRDLYAAIRSYDAAGNASPVSNEAFVHVTGYDLTGNCVNVYNTLPVAGLRATVTAQSAFELTTDAAGDFARADLAGGVLNVAVRTGGAGTAYHGIDNAFFLNGDVELFYQMIPYQPAPSPLIDNVLQLMLSAATGLNLGDVLKKWDSFPVDIHVPAFVNTSGVDYEALLLSAIDRWEARTGNDLFRTVGTVPALGIEFRYLPRSEMGIQNAYTEHINDADQYPERDIVRVLDEFVDEDKLFRILLHELGHTIRLNHLPSGFIMFGGQPLPADITDDEVLAVQLHTALPNGIDMSIYDPRAPVPVR